MTKIELSKLQNSSLIEVIDEIITIILKKFELESEPEPDPEPEPEPEPDPEPKPGEYLTYNDCDFLRVVEFTADIPYQELIKEKQLGEGAICVVYAG